MQYTANGHFGVRDFATKHTVWFTDENEARAYEKIQVALFLAEDRKKIQINYNSFAIRFVQRASLEDAQGKKEQS